MRRRASAFGVGQADAEDVVQEALLAIHLKRGTWDPGQPVGPWVAAIARNTEAYPITLTPEEATARYGVQGRLTFTEPVSVTTARDLHDFHTNSAIREDTIARRQGGVSTGMAARFGVGLAASILDPLNVASAFIPFFGEARIAAALGGTVARGVGGRMIVRAAEGAGQGLAGAAALEPLNLWLSRQDQDDYGMGDVLVNLAFGTALGGVAHTGLGLVRDARQPRPLWSPEQNEAALRQATAATAEGNPVAAAAAMEFTAARAARTELTDWYATVTRADAEARAAETTATTRAEQMRQSGENLTKLRDEMAQVQRERQGVADNTLELGLSPLQRRQIRELEATLADPAAPAGERIAAEIRRLELLDEGQAAIRPYNALEAARNEAQDAGLARVEARLRSAVALAEAKYERAADRTLRADQVRDHRRVVVASRERTVLDLAERTIRRAAGRLGVQLAEGEALDMASKFLRAGPDKSPAVLDDILSDLSKRAPAGPYLPSEVVAGPSPVIARAEAQMRARETAAERGLADSTRGTEDPRDISALRDAEVLAKTTPIVDGSAAEQLTDAQKQVAELEATLKAAEKQGADEAVAAGRDPPEPDPELVAAADLAKEGEAMARAYEAAAVCGLRGA